MSLNERPEITSEYTLSGALRAGSGKAVGLAAAAARGAAGSVVAITDADTAASSFGGNMAELVSVLLQNGAGTVYCCAVEDGDYAGAFAALMEVSEVRLMVCDSASAAVHAALRDAIAGADEKSRYRIGIVESGAAGRDALIAAAQALNSERMVLVSHSEAGGRVGAVAAAVCGAIAGEDDPAVPLSGAALKGLGTLGANFSDGDLNLLVRGGVLPIETIGSGAYVIRGITTRSTTNGTADATWRELSTILIVDEVIPAVRSALKAQFLRTKNTAQTRGAIRTRVVVALEDYLAREIIESYDNVSAVADEGDPTRCCVSFDFGVAHGLNAIHLRAQITV